MFNVCPRCGEYAVEKTIDPAGPFAVCPFCTYAHPFFQQPLFLITGASGAGKTAVCLELVARLRGECVVLESDILWGTMPEDPEKGYQEYYNQWLRVAKNVGQGERPVVLCGTALPEQYEICPERRYFSTIHYFALVCENGLLVERLKQRPAWQESGGQNFLEKMVQFNTWLKEHAVTTEPAMILYDTSQHTLAETTRYIEQWILQRL